jgi:hypothetical protein
MFLVEPPDAFEGPHAGGYPRRTAANLEAFSRFADKYVGGDPVFGVGNAQDNGVGGDHAYTVEYDVEALWVPDDRDSVWSDLASDAKSFYPGGAATNDGPLSGQEPVPIPPPPFTVRPGVDDQFPKGFFHDYNADYWYITGVPVPAHRGNVDGDGTIDPGGPAPMGGALPGGLIPAILNSGVSGLQVAVNALVNQVVLVRCLNAAYNTIEVSFPVDVVIIAFDGRALGVPPFGAYNHAFELKAGVPYRLSTARRFDALIRSSTPVHGAAVVKFYESRGLNVRPLAESLLVTARIPIDIT